MTKKGYAGVAIVAVLFILFVTGMPYLVTRSSCEDRNGQWHGQYPFDYECEGGIPNEIRAAYCNGGIAWKKQGIAADTKVPEWDHYCQPGSAGVKE